MADGAIKPGKIDARVAKRRLFPIDQRGNSLAVDQDISGVAIAMN
jgi:hypothetical protein